jgi:pyruvoyl-dependent arginine decarboxylase (PvlArgDC)
MPFAFTTIHHGELDKLGLASELERFANDQWIGNHYTEEHALTLVKERFKRHVRQELELIELQILDRESLTSETWRLRFNGPRLGIPNSFGQFLVSTIVW